MDNASTTTTSSSSSSGGSIVVLKYWHVILVLVVQLLGLGVAYGRITATQDDMSRRLANIENSKVISREEFDSWRTEFQQNIREFQRALIQNAK